MILIRAIGCVLLGVMVTFTGTPVHAETSHLVLASAHVKKQVFADLSMPWTAEQRCTNISLAKSNKNWALMNTSPYGFRHCSPASSHTQVLKLTAKGWRQLFYDMENNGCRKFHMPTSVRKDFSPYVC